jgi:transcriptional regulator with XRE-family HTH domain
MEPGQTFGPRLRRERERRHISLESIAVNTKISLSLLEALERDDVRRWPSGIFRRSFLRSYAQAIGLDPGEVLREFLERFPDPTEAERTAAAVLPAAAPVTTRIEAVPGAASPSQIDIVLRLRVPRTWVDWIRWAFERRPVS